MRSILREFMQKWRKTFVTNKKRVYSHLHFPCIPFKEILELKTMSFVPSSRNELNDGAMTFSSYPAGLDGRDRFVKFCLGGDSEHCFLLSDVKSVSREAETVIIRMKTGENIVSTCNDPRGRYHFPQMLFKNMCRVLNEYVDPPFEESSEAETSEVESSEVEKQPQIPEKE